MSSCISRKHGIGLLMACAVLMQAVAVQAALGYDLKRIFQQRHGAAADQIARR
jgi:hypothetical protein